LIVSRLTDKGLLPYDGGELDPAKLEGLNERERAVLQELILEWISAAVEVRDALAKSATLGLSRFQRLRLWLSTRWFALRLFGLKKRAK
jgi:hypothetical protein